MMPLIGEIDAAQLGLWVLGLMAVGLFIFGALRTWAAIRPQPPLHEQFVSQREFGEFKRRMENQLTSINMKLDRGFDALSEQLTDGLREINTTNERRAADLHTRINSITSQVTRNTTLLEKQR